MRGLLVASLLLMLLFAGLPGSATPPEEIEAARVPHLGEVPSGPFGIGPGTAVEDLGRLPLPFGFERLASGPVEFGSVLTRPASGDDGALLPDELAYPWPADDLDGDGPEETYLVEWPDVRPRDETRLLTFSGADGAASAWTEEADWIAPPTAASTAGGMLQMTQINEVRHEVEENGWTIWMWDGRFVVRDALTGDVLWERPTRVHLDEPLGGAIEFLYPAVAGPLVDPEGQVVLLSGRYEWTHSVSDGSITYDGAQLLDLRTGAEHYAIPLDSLPIEGVLEGPDGTTLYGTKGSSVHFLDPTDGSLLERLDLGFPIRAVREVLVEGKDALVAHSPEDGRETHVALIAANGTLEWNRHLPVTQFMYPIGEVAGSSRMAFGQRYADCVEETLSVTLGTFELPSGDIQWQMNETLHWNAGLGVGLSLASGDLDGDRLGDPGWAFYDWGYRAVFEEHDLCAGRGSWILIYEEDPKGSLTILSGDDGESIVGIDLVEAPGAPILGTLDPTARVRTIPLFEQRLSSVYALHWQELHLHAWDFQNDTYRSTLVDAHAELSWQRSWRWDPVDFFSGDLERVYIYWSSQSHVDEDTSYRRYTISVLDAHTAEEVWRYGTPRPYDVPLQDLPSLQGTPFEY